jgi:hypothetical protein
LDGVEHPREELTRTSDEGLAGEVLLFARRFPDDDERGSRIADAEDDFFALAPETASLTVTEFARELTKPSLSRLDRPRGRWRGCVGRCKLWGDARDWNRGRALD